MNAQARERVPVVIAEYDEIARIVARRIREIIEESREAGKAPTASPPRTAPLPLRNNWRRLKAPFPDGRFSSCSGAFTGLP